MVTTKRTIKLKKYLDIIEEYVAGGTITPGMVVEIYQSSTATRLRAHNHEDGDVAPLMVALENELLGGGIDDNYATGDQVQVWVVQRGEQFYGLLENGSHVEIGDKLTSKGNGRLKKWVADSDTPHTSQIVAVALEHRDLSGSSGADEGYRIMVVAA